jgi:hypothetical protein
MDERLEKAFQTANYMATLTNQRRVAFEEFTQNLIYYTQGSSFLITKELLAFVGSMISLGHTQNVIVIDDNNVPVSIPDLTAFQELIVDQYHRATNTYYSAYTEIKSKRKVQDLINL